MAGGIFVTSTEPFSSKSLVVLGLLEILRRSGDTRRIGFFKPILESESSLIIYDGFSSHSWGVTQADAALLLSGGKIDELLKRIIEKYREFEKQCDVIVCSGSDFRGASTPTELDLNIEIARNLGCSLLAVLRGRDRTVDEIFEAIVSVTEATQKRGINLLALIVNRVPPESLEMARARSKSASVSTAPIYMIPENERLSKPTIREIANSIKARFIAGESACDGREVLGYKVASMELPHLLERLTVGSLVITGADRSDVVLGTLAAEAARTFPRLAGLILTGGLPLNEKVQQLISGFNPTELPILCVETDTFETAVQVSRIQGRLGLDDRRKLSTALAVFDAAIDTRSLSLSLQNLFTDQDVSSREARMTPLMFEYELIQGARKNRKKIVLPEGDEPRILRAAELLQLREVCDLTLLGEPEKVRAKIAELGLMNLENLEIIDPIHSPLRMRFAEEYVELRRHKGVALDAAFELLADPSYFGTMMVKLGHADGMVSGSIHTTQHTIRPALEFIKTKPGFSIVSSVFFMCLSDRVLVFGDCAINPNPNEQELAEIAISSADTASSFGIEPRIAMLSYSSGQSGIGREVDKVREATRLARSMRPELLIEGPIQFDAAFDPEVARIKMPESPVAGRATVFIFPDLNTGNNTYKAVQRSAHAVAIGPVLQGLKRPVNDLSRGCTVADILNTVAITAIQAQSVDLSSRGRLK